MKPILCLALLGTMIPIAAADSTVDCERTLQWKRSGGYYRNDKVKHTKFDESKARQYRCDDELCNGEPSESVKWKLVGRCQ